MKRFLIVIVLAATLLVALLGLSSSTATAALPAAPSCSMTPVTPQVSAARSPNSPYNLILSWPHDPLNTGGYRVYSDTYAYVGNNSADLHLSVPEPVSSTVVNGTAVFTVATETEIVEYAVLDGTNPDDYYYAVQGVADCNGSKAYSPPSSQVGFFRFGLEVDKPAEEAGMPAWSRRDNAGTPETLIQWFTFRPTTGTSYDIYRQEIGGGWDPIGTAAPAGNHEELVAILGGPLADRLAADLSSTGTPLTGPQLYNLLLNNNGLVRELAQEHYQVALAMGLAYIDPEADPAGDWAYYVAESGQTTPLMKAVCVPATPLSAETTGVEESMVVNVPGDLGIAGSSRPLNAPERYSWDQFQQVRRMDGRIHLSWDKLPQPASISSSLTDCLDAAGNQVAGYHVYHNADFTGNVWKLANLISSSGRVQLVDAVDKQAPDSVDDEPYFFVDNPAELDPSLTPEDVYNLEVGYRVCPVDYFGNPLDCGEDVVLTMRDLDSPAEVYSTTVMPIESHDYLTMTWSYRDPEESSGPVSFHIMRSPTATLGISRWVTIDTVSSVGSLNITGTYAITDTPPQGIPHWYAVQVRDDAGNWSAMSAPQKGALYPRDPLTLAEVMPGYDPEACDFGTTDSLPMTLTGLDPDARQLALYRSFVYSDNLNNWKLVERFRVQNGTVTIDDDHLPPVGTVAYYRIELLDGHGNVSPVREFCAELSAAEPPQRPSSSTTPPTTGGGAGNAMLNWTGTTDQALIDICRPDGQVDTYSTTNTSFSIPLAAGEQVETAVRAQRDVGTANTLSEPKAAPVRNVNNFLDTDRHMADLGPLYDVSWVNVGSGDPQVRIQLDDQCTVGCGYAWWVAAFRRVPGGNWMQVTEVTPVTAAVDTPHVLWDDADPSPTRTYEYTVLAFSGASGPAGSSFEVIGYWDTGTLNAAVTAPGNLESNTIADAPYVLPATCDAADYNTFTPGSVDMPEIVDLGQDWYLLVDAYYENNNSDCPEMNPGDLNNAYGEGTVVNAAETIGWPTQFVALDVDGGNLNDGRFTAFPDELITQSGRLPLYVHRADFFAGGNLFEATVQLPDDLLFVKNQVDRWPHLRTSIADVNGDMLFAGATVSGLAMVDENLPWQLLAGGSQLTIRPDEISLGSAATTSYRLTHNIAPVWYDGVTPVPVNNMDYLTGTYQSSDAAFTADGLSGSFVKNNGGEFATSLPAAFVIGYNSAAVTINQSEISSGVLQDAQILFEYIAEGSDTDYMTYDSGSGLPAYHDGQLNGACGPNSFNLADKVEGSAAQPVGQDLAIGPGGDLYANVNLSDPVVWPGYRFSGSTGEFYAAAVAFADAPTAGAPMPAENAWQRRMVGTSELDPGLNLNAPGGGTDIIDLFYYGGESFDAVTNLYVRRGGVSQNIQVSGGGTLSTNAFNYTEELISMEANFIDNTQIPTFTMEMDLYLPYPTDTVLPLQTDQLGTNGFPMEGEFRTGTISLTHKYWNFQQATAGWRYNTDLSGYAATGGGNPLAAQQEAVFALDGRTVITSLTYVRDGLGPKTFEAADLPISSEWLANGDYGDIQVNGHDDDLYGFYYRISGFAYALSDIKLSRYHGDYVAENPLPLTLSMPVTDTLGNLDPAVLLNGDLSPDSLLACAATDPVGCGFTILDGDGMVDYFGEIGSDVPDGREALNILLNDSPVGGFPIASTNRTTITVQNIVEKPSLHWAWPIANDYLDFDIPVKFLANSEGGTLAAVFPDFGLLPVDTLEIIKGDLGAVATVGWKPDAEGFEDQIGIFMGYNASQAAFRALAMSRPKENGDPGLLPYTTWSDVEVDIIEYAEKFGYEDDGQRFNGNDPIDLAYEMWTEYYTPQTPDVRFDNIYQSLQPKMRFSPTGEYGIVGLQTGNIISQSGVLIERGFGQAVFNLPNSEGGFQIENIFFGAKIAVEMPAGPPGETETLVSAEWLSMEYNRDGEFIIRGDDVSSDLTGDYEIVADFILLIGTRPGYERIEGGITIDELEVEAVTFRKIGAVFGVGRYDYTPIFYIGLKGEASWDKYRLGGAVLFGQLYDSPVLREAGFGDAVSRLQSENPADEPVPTVFLGAYLSVFGDFPVYNDSLVKANGSGEIRAWYFRSEVDMNNDGTRDAVYGGQINAGIYATVAEVVSGRGSLGLSIERIFEGNVNAMPPGVGSWPALTRECQNVPASETSCTAFTGTFWVAAGIGACSPETWTSWNTRWWDDEWCAQAGAIIGLGYMQYTTPEWAMDYELDFENPFE